MKDIGTPEKTLTCLKIYDIKYYSIMRQIND
uniref:Uncharacterized protein n=1 Tax=Dulem virus 29 TaxID=3145747 RepID=A0AAU8B1J6_9CAUD